MRRLVLKHDVKPEQITAIRVRAGSNILNPLRYPIATNELEAKFCPAFMVSAIALRRKAGIHEFNDEFVQSAPVQALMRKVERVLDPEIEAKGWEKIRSTVEVDLADGRKLVEHADERYRGGPGPAVHARRALREVERLRVARAAAVRHRRGVRARRRARAPRRRHDARARADHAGDEALGPAEDEPRVDLRRGARLGRHAELHDDDQRRRAVARARAASSASASPA